MNATATNDRRARRRAQTQSRLIAAAREVFAQQGIEATRINEITEAADVGFGSFYNYFDSKEAIVAAVLEEMVAEAGAAIDEVTAGVEDPAEVVAVAHRSLVERAASDPEWGWLLVRLEVSHDILRTALGPYAARDLARGVEAGRFEVPDAEVALTATGGALLAVMRATLDGQTPKNAAVTHATCVLQMLGMSPESAREVASRPLPGDGD